MTPQSFRDDLKRFDKRLDFQWNPMKSVWEVFGIDRKNQKYVIKIILLGQLDTLGTWVLQDLYECSPMKQGGSKALNRKIDEEIKRNEQRQEADYKNKLDAVNNDAYIKLKYRAGERLSFATPERCKDFIITDRRRVQENTVSA